MTDQLGRHAALAALHWLPWLEGLQQAQHAVLTFWRGHGGVAELITAYVRCNA